MSSIDGQQVREAAEAIIRNHATDIEFLSINEYVADHLPQDTEQEHDSVCQQVDSLIRQAYLAVQWEDS